MPRAIRIFAALSVVLAALAPTPQPQAPQSQPPQANATNPLDRTETIAAYNLGKDGLAIEGYDPVAYFAEGGAKPRQGKKDLEIVYASVRYRFATKENKERFEKNPTRYEPAYGGWCAYAMASAGSG